MPINFRMIINSKIDIMSLKSGDWYTYWLTELCKSETKNFIELFFKKFNKVFKFFFLIYVKDLN